MSVGGFNIRVRNAIWLRDNGSCVRCGVSLAGTRGSYQHRRARGMGGSSDPLTGSVVNGVLMCGHATSPDGCHHWAESHPSEALQYGYRVPQGGDPALFPILVHGRGWVLLSALGDYLDVDHDEHEVSL